MNTNALTAKHWHEIVGRIAPDAGMDDQVAPFGFEAGSGYFNAEKTVLRLYVFYKSAISDEGVALDRLLKSLKAHYPAVHEKLGIVGSGKIGFHSIKQSPSYSDYFLAIEQIETTKTVLQSYSEYISGSVYLIASGLLPELARVDSNALARLRIRQLFWISCQLYPDLLEDSQSLVKRLSYRSIGVDPTLKITDQTEVDDIRLIREKCADFVGCNRSQYTWKIDVFAGGGQQEISFDREMFLAAVSKIRKGYLDFYQ